MSELSRETRELLARGRGGGAAASSRARMKRHVLAQVAGSSVVATTTTAAARVAIAKFLGVASVVVAVGGGAGLVSRGPAPASTPVVAVSTPAAPVAHPNPGPRLAAPIAPTGAPSASPTVPDSRPEPPTVTPPIAAPPPARPVARAVYGGASRAATPNVAPARNEPSGAAVAPMPSPDVSAVAIAPSRSSLPPRSSFAPRSSLEDDARLLRGAHAALAAGDAAGALRLLELHAARFPASALEPERSAERVFALCLARRADDARAAADGFLRMHPDGPLARRVRASCGGRSP
jgi:hypothetical protein